MNKGALNASNANGVDIRVSKRGSLSIQTVAEDSARYGSDSPSGLLLHSAIVKEGTSVRQIKELADQLGLPEDELGRRCGMSRPTLHRRKKAKGVLSRIEADLWARFALLLKQATDAFESEDAARKWLNSPQIGLGNQVPLDLALTTSGFREVEKLLTRVDRGVYA